MLRAVARFPAIVNLLLVTAVLMLVPASMAATQSSWAIARTFLYNSLFFMIIAGILGIATMRLRPRLVSRYHLFSLFLAYIALPVVLAAPLYPLVVLDSFWEAYLEMLSCLSTTGATLFDRPSLVAEPLHLWRALVGWLGGLMVLVTAFAILAPLNLGGFEIERIARHAQSSRIGLDIDEAAGRLTDTIANIAPVYIGATGTLAVILIMLGEAPFVAACHAMSTLATSGISPIGELSPTGAGRAGEAVLLIFLLPAITHRGVTARVLAGKLPDVNNPQFRLMLIAVLGVTLLLFLRSFIGAADLERDVSLAAMGKALWGATFTALSFITTTGFESQDWRAMQLWSGLSDPGIILLGLAVMGGGVATTAGGIKLLRLYALYRHGLREMELLLHPSSVGGRVLGERLISDRAAHIAFVFLMLFLASLAVLLTLFSLFEIPFEHALAASVAALTTTGPALHVTGDGFTLSGINTPSQVVFALGMIVGRMETLVIVSLFNPLFWRN